MTTQGAPLSSAILSAPELSIFQSIESYPFATDEEFQTGLTTILSSNSAQDPELLTLRARCFYFARKHNVSIGFESYKKWRYEQNLPSVTAKTVPVRETPIDGIAQETDKTAVNVDSPGQPAAPYPSSFGQIVDLITKGEPIPGIKEIPDTLLTGHQSAPSTAKRKKPWENSGALIESPRKILEYHG
ncbi:MAG: hypothetical protein Q9209_001385 [Squamulea sp. 1 TL-2023]